MGRVPISQVQERDVREFTVGGPGLEPGPMQEISPGSVATRPILTGDGACSRLGTGIGGKVAPPLRCASRLWRLGDTHVRCRRRLPCGLDVLSGRRAPDMRDATMLRLGRRHRGFASVARSGDHGLGAAVLGSGAALPRVLADLGLLPPGLQLISQRFFRNGGPRHHTQQGQQECDRQSRPHRLERSAATMTESAKHGHIHSLADAAISDTCCSACFPRSMTSMCLQHATFIAALRFIRGWDAILYR